MDKNTIIGFILMALVILGFSWLNRPNEEEIAAQKAERERIEQEVREQKEKSEEEQNISKTDFSEEEPDTSVILENDLISLKIGTRGGIINSAILKDYFSYATGNNDSIYVNLVDDANSKYGFILTTSDRRFITSKEHFEPKIVNDSVVEMTLDFTELVKHQSLSETVIETLSTGPSVSTTSIAADTLKADGLSVRKGTEENKSLFTIRYTLPRSSYIVRMEIIQQNMSEVISPSVATGNFKWEYLMMRNELGRTFEENKSSLTYKYVGDSPDEMSQMKNDSKELNQKVRWIAFKNQFFSVVSLPRSPFNTAKLTSEPIKDNSLRLKSLSYETTFDYSSVSASPFAMDIYMGPNLYPLLSSLDDTLGGGESLQLTRLIPLGWPIIRWINTLIIIPTFTWLGTFITNYGIIILLLTIFIKIIIYPFTYKSLLSQSKMRVLAPEIKEINDKYPGQDNAMVRNQKTMALYSRAGASPMAGCLPMILQMPVLFAMFWFFPSCIELRGKAFLWAQNLAAPDYICTLPFKIPFYGDRVSLFCLLMTICNIASMRITMQSQATNNSMPGMKWMMYLMPVMFLCFFNDYAAGLSYYYLLSLLITILMTYIFRKCVNEDKLRQKMKERASKTRKKSKWMERLEEAQRRQQASLREQQRRKGR